MAQDDLTWSVVTDDDGRVVLDDRGNPLLNVRVGDHVKNPNVVLTGPDSRGTVRTSDGTSYDVTPTAILVESKKHAQEVARGIEADLIRRGVLNVGEEQ